MKKFKMDGSEFIEVPDDLMSDEEFEKLKKAVDTNHYLYKCFKDLKENYSSKDTEHIFSYGFIQLYSNFSTLINYVQRLLDEDVLIVNKKQQDSWNELKFGGVFKDEIQKRINNLSERMKSCKIDHESEIKYLGKNINVPLDLELEKQYLEEFYKRNPKRKNRKLTVGERKFNQMIIDMSLEEKLENNFNKDVRVTDKKWYDYIYPIGSDERKFYDKQILSQEKAIEYMQANRKQFEFGTPSIKDIDSGNYNKIFDYYYFVNEIYTEEDKKIIDDIENKKHDEYMEQFKSN